MAINKQLSYRTLILALLLVLPLSHVSIVTYMDTSTPGIAQQDGDEWWYGTITILKNGSVDPANAPVIVEGNTYTLTKNVKSDGDGIVVLRDNIVVDGAGHTIEGTNGFRGVDLTNRTNITLKNLNIRNFDVGIFLQSSSNNTITGNNITGNNRYGIYSYGSLNNTITGNNITGNKECGIALGYSSSNIVSGNVFVNDGLVLGYSSSNIVSGNVFVNDGLIVLYSYGNVVKNNTVNGKPLVYLEGVSGYTVTGEAGQVVLVNCTNIRVEGLTITNTDVAIELWMTKNTIITNNTITNNRYGIYSYGSLNNTITGNNIIGNNRIGIYLWRSPISTITGNNIIGNNGIGIYLWTSPTSTITGNNIIGNNGDGLVLEGGPHSKIAGNNITGNSKRGIYLDMTFYNTIRDNYIGNNGIGIYLWESSNNTIYNNVFVNDVNAVVEGGGVNYWNIEKTLGTNIVGGPYLGGNYWSGFSEICLDTDGDSICDQPYVIDENNVDYYPLALPRAQRSYLFVVDTSGSVWYRVFDGENWGDWVPLRGIVLDAPSVAYYNGTTYIAVRGEDGSIWYGYINTATGEFSGWIPISGIALDAPSVASYDGKVYIAVRGEDGSIWYGYINTATGEFSGWIPISGLTPSRPTLVSAFSGVLLIARGLGDDIWIYPLTWPDASWINMPGLTVDAPAAAAVGDEVHIVVRGLDGCSLWHGVLDVSTWSFTGWNSIHGATDSTPELLVDKSTGTTYLAVKDLGNGVSINIYTKTLGWHEWITIPGGLTDRGPAVEIINNKLIVVIKDLGEGIWYNIKQPDEPWIGWTPIDGLTQHQPEILTIPIPLGYVIK